MTRGIMGFAGVASGKLLPLRWWLKGLRHPWGAMLLGDVLLCRILALLPLPLLAMTWGRWPWPCPFHALTGLPCPGCGMTRALAALLAGEWRQAMFHHPFVLVAAGIWLILAVGAMLDDARRRRLCGLVADWEHRTALSGLLLVAFGLFGLVRMFLVAWGRLVG